MGGPQGDFRLSRLAGYLSQMSYMCAILSWHEEGVKLETGRHQATGRQFGAVLHDNAFGFRLNY